MGLRKLSKEFHPGFVGNGIKPLECMQIDRSESLSSHICTAFPFNDMPLLYTTTGGDWDNQVGPLEHHTRMHSTYSHQGGVDFGGEFREFGPCLVMNVGTNYDGGEIGLNFLPGQDQNTPASRGHVNMPEVNDAVTIITRIYPLGGTDPSWAHVGGMRQDGGSNLEYGIALSDAGGGAQNVNLRCSGSADYQTGHAVQPNEWSTIVARMDGQANHWDMRIWIDGVRVLGGTSSNNILAIAFGDFFNLGHRYAQTRNFDGRIDYYHAWARFLSDGEVEALVRNPWLIYEPLIPIYHFVSDAAPSGDITSTSTLVTAEASNIYGEGDLTADDPLTLSETADPHSPGEMDGWGGISLLATGDIAPSPGRIGSDSPLDFTETADLEGFGLLTVNGTLVFGESGVDLDAFGLIEALSTLIFGEAGADLTNAVTGDITANSSLTLSEVADISAMGQLVVNGTLTFSEAANLLGLGDLTVNTTLVFSETPDLDSLGQIEATSTVTSSEAAALNAFGQIEITTTLVLGENAAIYGAGLIEALSTLVFGEAGVDLVAVGGGEISANSPLDFTHAADLDALGQLLADSSLVFSENGDIQGLGDLAAISTLIFGEAGADLIGVIDGNITSTSTLTTSETADLDAPGRLTVTSLLLFTELAVLFGLGTAIAITGLIEGEVEMSLTSDVEFSSITDADITPTSNVNL